MSTLEQFKNYVKKINDFEHAAMILNWDMETKMPKKGAKAHISALTTLSSEAFKMSISGEMKGYLDTLSMPDEWANLDEISRKMVEHIKEGYEESKNIPEDLYARYVELTSTSQNVWGEAKHNSDFETMRPYFEEMISLNKTMAQYIDPNKKPYDVLLNRYEKGIDEATITRTFEKLKKGVIPLLEAIKEKPKVDESMFKGEFAKEGQEKLGYYLLEAIGYSLEAGRLDESEHPFTIGNAPCDVRITTNYDLTDLRSSAFSILHEGGHGLYEQHINPALIGTTLNTGTSMGIHESQSRFYENIVGRNKHFWMNHYNKISEIFPSYKNVSLEAFYKGMNVVQPSLIRTEADELTYNLHVIIRFELEKALFDGTLEVKDLPIAWHDKMQAYLGIVPVNHKEGVLQDVHWAGGMFGYFPSYALGNIYGGQFLMQIEKELGGLDTLLEKGELMKVSDWLTEHVHTFGCMKAPMQIIQDACQSHLDATPIIRYYTDKYTKLYNL